MKRGWLTLGWLAVLGCTAEDRPQTRAPTRHAIDDGARPSISGDHNLVRNGAFEDGAAAPWRTTVAGTAAGKGGVEDGALCVHVERGGTAAWDVQLRHRALGLLADHTYVVELVAWADRRTRARPRVGRAGPPYEEYWASEIDLGPTKQRFRGYFRKREGDDDAAELTVQLGGPLVGKGSLRICIDDVVLADPKFEPPPPPSWATAPKIRVNQLGYFPQRAKHATYATAATAPVHWTLLDAEDKPAAEGETVVFGADAASGDFLHTIDFGGYTKPGEGYRLAIGDARSDAFAIGDDIYARLRRDAMAYFYHNRSGTPIVVPFAGDARWVRGVGHPGDAKVECLPELKCPGTFDASGGWYDAGDHGKYPVPAGITLWTLMNAYEWATHRGGATAGFGDGTLAIPEHDNAKPDLLDEARWELELLLRLQKRKGEWAGMVFHKLHEQQWAPIPAPPDEATTPRFLHRPSTAATLDFAAVTAQAARVYRSFDPAFADRCLAASERAWKAALGPVLLAPGSDTTGGGAYEDSKIEDERYWAAVELFVTTGKPEYRKALAASPHYLAMSGPGPNQGGASASMNWQGVEALGTLTLALVPNELGDSEVVKARARVIAVAHAIVDVIATHGYRVPLRIDASGGVPWGSNSAVLNNMVVLGIAYELDGDEALRTAVIDGMDYLLGRNPMGMSYVSGQGTRAMTNPHHRFWAHQKDERFPPPPPGAVSGGPNTGVNDPTAKAAGLAGQPALKSYIDHIESWSTNEVAINWNAPLAWTAAWLDVRGRGK
ncbi:MAG: glycoside hydrolase family 9 protein [Deltaproteobacteria bacterium]|nr:glycoside hydrolase family 9 protein [Nannocystaceae bacterium]